ncbi:MAG: hypothetical protein MH321_04390 [Leptospiraceae bacterium]|nr:hypothetical protein [Leptospiraceae bacterium]
MQRFSLYLIIFSSFLLNCATYWENRRKDAQDIFHVGVETPVYGAGFRIGPLPLGLYFAGGESELGKKDLGSGLGLRGGEFGAYHSQALVYGFLGGEDFYSGEPLRTEEGKVIIDKHGIGLTSNERANLKSYKMRYFSYFDDPISERKKRKKAEFRKKFIEELIQDGLSPELQAYIPEEDKKPYGYPSQFLWQVDLFLGIYGGARAGFNLAECADFLVGFTTLDMLDDDIASDDSSSE